jgi:hypothetical protein
VAEGHAVKHADGRGASRDHRWADERAGPRRGMTHIYTCTGGGIYKEPSKKYNNRKTNTYLIDFMFTFH